MKNILSILFICISFAGFANKQVPDSIPYIICADSLKVCAEFYDTVVFNKLIKKILHDTVSAKPLNDVIEYVAKFLLNTSYGYPARHYSKEEKLMVSFDKLDCVTYVETVLALSHIILEKKTGFCDFSDELKYIRYRQGKLGKFPTRLHYFTDWIYDNEQKRIVEDFSGKIDTVVWKKKINYMTTHKHKYRELYDTSNYNQIKKTEKELTSRKKYYLPKEKFNDYKSKIKTGDILVLTVNTAGLDVSHTGFALWQENDLYLIHASKSKHKVTITSIPFKEYIDKIKKVTGILVARPVLK